MATSKCCTVDHMNSTQSSAAYSKRSLVRYVISAAVWASTAVS